VVENGDVPRRRGVRRNARPLESGHDVLGGNPDAAGREGRELVERPRGSSMGSRVDAGVLDRRRRVEPPRVPHHHLDETTGGCDRIVLCSQLDERRDGRAAQAFALLVDACGIGDRPAPKPSFDEVDRPTFEARER
jgi:hypothetical protein